jgi:Carbohydrate family 9 binding domain-like
MNRDTIIGLSVAFLVVCFALWQGMADTATESTAAAAASAPVEKPAFGAAYGSPIIDGAADDDIWQRSLWLPVNQVWLGEIPSTADFEGRYKVAWDENNLYILAEITDDVLTDSHPDGLVDYWDDDCLEIFLDEDASGGIHQYDYNAFAYHLSIFGQVTDMGTDQKPHYYNDHCTYKVMSEGNKAIWEVAIKVFDGKRYTDGGENIPKLLSGGKKIGFALAYCDNDHSPKREHFIGNVPIGGPDKNRAWIDASLFGTLNLAEY